MLSKKLIIIVAAAVVVVGGGGGFFYMKKKKAAAAAAAEAAKAKENPDQEAQGGAEEDEDEPASGGGEGEGASGPAVLQIKKIVNLQGPNKSAYLKCELAIVFRDPEIGKQAASDKPTLERSMVESMVLTALSQMTLEEATDPESREALRNELKEQLNEKFAPKPLKPGEKEDKKHKRPKHPVKDVLVVDWAIAR
nr:flagellar basal body-associated FliL family protein [uncultured Holophaga sp.]